MIDDDDLYVVIVDDTNDAADAKFAHKPGNNIKSDPGASYLEIDNDWKLERKNLREEDDDDIENLLYSAQEHGKLLHVLEDDEAINTELSTEKESYLYDNYFKPKNIIFDGDRSSADSDEDDNTQAVKDINWRRKNSDSLVQKLKMKFPHLRYNNEYMVRRLAQLMEETIQPNLPPDYAACDGDNYRCKFCNTLSPTEPVAQRHYQEKHGEKYLSCYACSATFRSREILYKHEKLSCQSSDIGLVLRARALSLGRLGRLQPVVSSQRGKPRERFPCTECSATFANKSSLEPHLRMHRGERPFRCTQCTGAFTSNIALTHHMKKHTGVQFICDYCGKAFKEKAKLVTHFACHAPRKRYSCKECPKQYSMKSDLAVHVNKDHRNMPLPFDCKICPKRFARMASLQKHMKRTHGMKIITSRMFARQLPAMTEKQIENQLKQAVVVLKNSDSEYNNDRKEHYEA